MDNEELTPEQFDDENYVAYHENPLLYRPEFDKTEVERTGWETSSFDNNDFALPEPELEIGDGLVTDMLTGFDTLKSTIADSIKNLEKKMKKLYLFRDVNTELQFGRAREELGLNSGDVTYLDYKTALEHSDTSAGAYIVDVIEKAIEGIAGSLEWEIYGQYVEMKSEMDLVDDYTEKIIHPLVGFAPNGENLEKSLLKAEEDWNSERLKVMNIYEERKSVYYDAMIFEPDKILSSRDAMFQSEIAHEEKLFEYNQVQNALVVIQNKSLEVEKMHNRLHFLLEEESGGEIFTADLCKLTESNKEAVRIINSAQLSLTYAVDSQNREKSRQKNLLRVTYALPKQEKLLNELAVNQEVYRKETLPLLHYMRAFQEDVSKESSRLFGLIADGMMNNNTQLNEQMHAFYLNNEATSAFRQKQIQAMTDKEVARRSYHALTDYKTNI